MFYMKNILFLFVSCIFPLFGIVDVAIASSNPVQEFECNDYPGTEVTDVSGDGLFNIDGIGKLAKSELRGRFNLSTKTLIEKADDANRMRVLLNLLAYNCRAIQHSGSSPTEKEKAHRDVARELLEAIYPRRPSVGNSLSSTKRMTPKISAVDKISSGEFYKAAELFRQALLPAYESSLGGVYLPINKQYDFMVDETIASLAASEDLLDKVKNTRTYPESETHSIGYDACSRIKEANDIVERTIGMYGSKIREGFYDDFYKIRKSPVYGYFANFASKNQCSLFLGKLKTDFDARNGAENKLGYPIPSNIRSFNANEFIKFILAVNEFMQHSRALLDSDFDIKN